MWRRIYGDREARFGISPPFKDTRRWLMWTPFLFVLVCDARAVDVGAPHRLGFLRGEGNFSLLHVRAIFPVNPVGVFLPGAVSTCPSIDIGP